MIDPDDIRHGNSHMGAEAKLCIHAGVYVLFIIFSIFLRPCSAVAEDPVDVKGLRYHITSEYLRVVIDLSSSAEFSTGKLSNPERLFLDIKNSKISKDSQKNYSINYPLVKGIRLGQFNTNTARIVFDLASTDYDFKVFNLEDPSRLIIDVFPKASDNKKPVPGIWKSLRRRLRLKLTRTERPALCAGNL